MVREDWQTPLRWLARRYLFPAIEACWAAGFGLAGWATRPGRRARHWAPQHGQVVIIAPHPDDETAGAGGVAALHAQAGDPLRVVVVTDGGASRAGGLPRAEIVRCRAQEVTAAVRILGVRDLICLGLPEGQWDVAPAQVRLAPLLKDAAVVYLPSCVDYHPEHVRVARLVASLLQPDQTVRIYELGVPLTPLLVNLVADIGRVAAIKARALNAFATQDGALAPLRRLARYRAALYDLPAAEVFWELPAASYARVVAAGDWRRSRCPFRGVRERPLTDPLTALDGHKARTALRALARHDSMPAPVAGDRR